MNKVDNPKTQDAENWLMAEIAVGEDSARSDGWIDEHDILKDLSKPGERLLAFVRKNPIKVPADFKWSRAAANERKMKCLSTEQ